MNRRDFLKRSGFVGAGAAAGLLTFSVGDSLARDLIGGGRSVSRTTGVPRLPIPTTCMMCPARCGIIGYLEDHFLKKIEGNPRDSNSRGKICALGIAGMQYAYNPDRVLSPLKRIGVRGEGKWAKISWDEALDIIVTKINLLLLEKRSSEIIILNDFDFFESFTNKFFTQLGSPLVVNGEDRFQADSKYANQTSLGVEETVPDLSHTKYILNFGANLYEQHEHYVPLVSRLVEGRINGAKLVTFDPCTNNTSGKSTEWFPSYPGSELLIILSMANIILQRNLYSSDFINKYIDLSLNELSEFLSQFTPELAESASGIKESHIRRIAVEFATTKPAIAFAGGNIASQKDGVLLAFSIILLNSLVGNIDIYGGLQLPRKISLNQQSEHLKHNLHMHELFSELSNNSIKSGMLLTHQCNPLFSNPDTNSVSSLLKDENLIPFHVVFDSFLTETAELSDIFLPSSSYLESWGLHSPPSFEGNPSMVLQQPVISPIGQSRQFHWLLLEIIKKMGDEIKQNFEFDKIDKYVRNEAEKIQGLSTQGGRFDSFRDTGIWADPELKEINPFQPIKIPTSDGKINLRPVIHLSKNLFAGSPVTERKFSNNEFVLILRSSSIQSDPRSGLSMWLSEIEHDNFVWINNISAEELGIKNGDKVRLYTQNRNIEAFARLTFGIHQRAIAMNQNLGHWASGRISKGEKFESSDPNTEIIWWDEGSLQPHPMNLIEMPLDLDNEKQPLKNNIVKVERI